MNRLRLIGLKAALSAMITNSITNEMGGQERTSNQNRSNLAHAESRRQRVVACVSLLLLLLIFGVFVGIGFFQMKAAAKQSAQMSLLRELAIEIDEYQQAHGQYPETLEILPIRQPLPDGADRSLLPLFHYKTDGETYLLHTVGAFTQDEIHAISEKGRVRIHRMKASEKRSSP